MTGRRHDRAPVAARVVAGIVVALSPVTWPAALAAVPGAGSYPVGCIEQAERVPAAELCDPAYLRSLRFELRVPSQPAAATSRGGLPKARGAWVKQYERGVEALRPFARLEGSPVGEAAEEALELALEAFEEGLEIAQDAGRHDESAPLWEQAFTAQLALAEQIAAERLAEGTERARGRVRRAVRLYDDLAYATGDERAWRLNLAWARFRLGEMGEAETLLRAEIETVAGAERLDLVRALATMLADSGDWERGAELMTELIGSEGRMVGRRLDLVHTLRDILRHHDPSQLPRMYFRLVELHIPPVLVLREVVDTLERPDLGGADSRERLMFVTGYLLGAVPSVDGPEWDRLRAFRNDARIGAAVSQMFRIRDDPDPDDDAYAWWIEREEPIEGCPDELSPRQMLGRIAYRSVVQLRAPNWDRERAVLYARDNAGRLRFAARHADAALLDDIDNVLERARAGGS